MVCLLCFLAACSSAARTLLDLRCGISASLCRHELRCGWTLNECVCLRYCVSLWDNIGQLLQVCISLWSVAAAAVEHHLGLTA